MKIPLTYNVRSVRQRPVSTALTALGIGLVVAVFIAMLALAKTGSEQNVLVLRKGADSEMSSGLDRDAIRTLTASPHIARGPDGRVLASPEAYVVIPLGRMGTVRDVATWVWLLVAPETGWTTGNVVHADGGQVLGLPDAAGG